MDPMLRNKLAASAAGGALGLAVALTGHFEGLRSRAYLDPVGIPTICYGSTQGVRLGDTRTPQQCAQMLRVELPPYIAAADKAVGPMPDTRRAALGSFAYNVGIRRMQQSRVVRLLAAGDVQGGCDALRLYVYAGGQKLPGLVKRREAERTLCLMH